MQRHKKYLQRYFYKDYSDNFVRLSGKVFIWKIITFQSITIFILLD